MTGSAKLLGAGFVLVLGAGIALLFGLNSDAKPKAERASGSQEPQPTVVGSAGGTAAADNNSKPSSPLFPEVRPRPASQVPSIAVGVERPADEEVKYRPDGVPIAVADLDILRETAASTDDALRACAKEHGGEEVRGQLIATYVLARRKDETGKYITAVESTGYEEDGTTFTDPKLIECMHKTSLIQKFPPSNSPVAVWVRRRVTFEAGKLDINWVFQHGYIH